MNIASYLQRINISDQPAPTLENLKALQENHLKNIPFGNLDVIRKIPITLNIENFYKKIIERKREGYCYELNGLFNWLLTALNYDTHLIKCTVYRGESKWAMPGSHAAQIVTIDDEKYLTDVGFGSQNLWPVSLSGEVSQDESGTYRITAQAEDFYYLERKIETGFQPIYKFTLEKQVLENYADGLDYNQHSPKSTFTHHDLITMAIDDGRVTLKDRTLTIKANGQRREREITEKEFPETIQTYFGIDIAEVGR